MLPSGQNPITGSKADYLHAFYGAVAFAEQQTSAASVRSDTRVSWCPSQPDLDLDGVECSRLGLYRINGREVLQGPLEGNRAFQYLM